MYEFSDAIDKVNFMRLFIIMISETNRLLKM